MELLTTPACPEYVTINLPGPLPRTKMSNHVILIIHDPYKRLTRAIQTARATQMQVAHISSNNLVIRYEISCIALSDDGKQFVSIFFTSQCTYLGVEMLTKTVFHTQILEKAVMQSRTLVCQLQLYFANNQRNWNIFVQSLTYAYSYQALHSTSKNQFRLSLSGSLPGPTAIFSRSALTDDAPCLMNPKALR